ncbi:hypothetical protein COT75_01790 [Candidatus Beckwithbacteria bacterium CG10_big_fil_rev_8_21_14_0_10_34_10]|uniref:Nucleotidyl transferase domain-containing protein n=1 Tax=Candidatus Beckwithbacteria bacterium CG10_big_fil_rev_8_21_14_0_10_34_10 TaxID=1974495 RepID=A0A2H0W9P5_9BACT|nr:MAG: hypothetical protein COT75_01790 [Candidatus Beckwithbacteria bacterium CG10_big_fil_rev_8_21_14_0_10_34_10]
MKVFILSAGLGTRLRPLTNKIPKVLVKIGDKPVLEHLVILCSQYGFKDIIINLHHFPNKVREYFGDGKKWGVKIVYSYEKTIMGGAGALKVAEKYLNETFFVLNGDVMTSLNLRKMAKFHKKNGGLGTFIVHQTDHPYDSDLVSYDKNFKVLKFFRPKMGDKFKPVSKSGTHIFEPKVLKYIPQNIKYSLEKELIPDLLKKNKKLYVYYSNEYSKDMGTPERLKKVREDYEKRKI